MSKRLGWLPLIAAILLTKPDGGGIWIVGEQVAAVFAAKGVGAANTAIVTLGGTFFVRESPEAVAVRLGWRKP